MNVVLGPFHPHLEEALAQEVVARKYADPLAPVLIVVPAETIRRRVAWLLAGERGLALLNLHVLTFHQLSQRLYAEATGTGAPESRDEGAYEELVRHLIRLGDSDSPLAGLEETPGGCAALWQTLRDLKDARVAPEAFLEAVRAGMFERSDVPRLEALGAVYAAVLAAGRALGWRDYTELDEAAIDAVPQSSFLASCSAIVHYGFYDLTQVQYDLFRAVARHHDAVLLFPLVPRHPGWVFSERFYQRFLSGAATTTTGPADGTLRPTVARLFVDDPPDAPSPDRRGGVFICSGARDEVLTAAKEILRVVEDEGVGFAEIGVVARSLEPYGSLVAREFSSHGIPFALTAQQPAISFPLAQAVVRLLRVASGPPLREDVIDLISSPVFCATLWLGDGPATPDLWDTVSRRADVTTGWDSWRRLERMTSESEGGLSDWTRGTWREPTARLTRIVEGLRQVCAALPHEASGAEHAAAWRDVLERVLGLVTRSARDEAPDGSDEPGHATALLAAIEHPAALDDIRPRLTREEFVQAVQRRIEATRMPIGTELAPGVRVLDAMAARGLAFRVLFILGLNESVFPRVIREDAFLRDRERRVLETSLGYKIPEKLGGYDEERLLFSLLVGAARDRLYLCAQRSDEAGRPLSPSWYLDEWRRAVWGRGSAPADTMIPRRTREKREVSPFDRIDRLTPAEAAIRIALGGGDPLPWVDRTPARALLGRGRAVKTVIDESSASGAYDGRVGPLPAFLSELREAGFSATALQTYARCPLQFFLQRVVGVEARDRPEDREGPASADWGRLCHDVFARLYRGWTAPSLPSVSAAVSRLDAVCDDVFSHFARHEATGYPLVWELTTRTIKAMLGEAAAADVQELWDSGFVPQSTEVAVSGTLRRPDGVPIQGRLDRIDGHPDGRVRVIDFKVSLGRSAAESNLLRAVLRGERLQPPLYADLGSAYAARAGAGGPASRVEVLLYVVAPVSREGPLVRLSYRPDDEAESRVEQTLSLLIEGIEQGEFPMIPDSYCGWCDVAPACRRRHGPSRARARADARASRIAGIRDATVRSGRSAP
ncbi:MAG: exodeoxyribonuclease V subunit gamma [Nitrospirae bacterium]|nr:exodeoxyribonuclease V subunit gamma [Nitrospirota bacterium]